MDISTLPIKGTLFPFAIFGMIIGLMVGLGRSPVNRNEIWFYISAGGILGMIAGWNLLKRIVGFSRVYESEARSVEQDNTIVMVVSVPGLPERRIHGLTLEEWETLCTVVDRTGNFTQPILEDAFGTQKEGRRIHGLVADRLAKCGALVEYGNGYKVTDHIGKHLFGQVAKGDYEILNLLKDDLTPLPRA